MIMCCQQKHLIIFKMINVNLFFFQNDLNHVLLSVILHNMPYSQVIPLQASQDMIIVSGDIFPSGRQSLHVSWVSTGDKG